jgi:uncharacterized protein
MTTTALRLNVADLLAKPGSRRDARLDAVGLAGAEVATTGLDPAVPLVVDVVLERVADGIVVRGRIRCRWRGHCARCLREVASDVDCAVSELFEAQPLEGETYPLEGDEIDLEGPVRDTVMLELPVAPHCRDDCRGLCPVCGVDRNETECVCDPNPPDSRWDVLRELQL